MDHHHTTLCPSSNKVQFPVPSIRGRPPRCDGWHRSRDASGDGARPPLGQAADEACHHRAALLGQVPARTVWAAGLLGLLYYRCSSMN